MAEVGAVREPPLHNVHGCGASFRLTCHARATTVRMPPRSFLHAIKDELEILYADAWGNVGAVCLLGATAPFQGE